MKLRQCFIMLVIMFITSAHTSFARGNDDTAKTLVYGELGIARGTHKFMKAEINTVFRYNNIASLVIFHQFRKGREVPADYYNDMALGDGKPKEKFTAIGLLYGKMIFLKRDITRLSLKGGLVLGNMRMPTNFVNSGGLYYSHTVKETPTAGLLIDPSIEFPLARGFGLNFGGYALLAPAGAGSAGFQMSISFGTVSNL